MKAYRPPDADEDEDSPFLPFLVGCLLGGPLIGLLVVFLSSQMKAPK